MNNNCKPYWCYALIAVVFLVAGYFLGKYCSTCAPKHDGEVQEGAVNGFEEKSIEDLSADLSAVMLPQDEYQKLIAAIEQTAIGLLGAQAKSKNLPVDPAMEEKLKANIKEKYSRQYFTSINSDTMKELSKDDLVKILNFYASSAGVKIRDLTPKIISKTMDVVQKDLSAWLPEAVTAVLEPSAPQDNAAAAPPALGN